MTYCALLIPNDIEKKESKDGGFVQSLTGKLMSGLDDGGLTLNNATTLLKNTASLVSEGVDVIGNKFSGIALAQLLVDGKITNETAYGYLTQGFPRALGLTSVTMGFQSVEQLKYSLRHGINVQQFISSFQGIGSSLSDLMGLQDTRNNVDGFNIVEIDVVTNDSRSYQAETPDRRVESGQSYQEFIHNMPDILSLECYLENGRRYTNDEFEDILVNLRDSKTPIDIILGDTKKESYALTNFSPIREAMDGYSYSLEFKKIQVGQINLVELNIPTKVSMVKNAITGNNKTDTEKNLGLQTPEYGTKQSLIGNAKKLFAFL